LGWAETPDASKVRRTSIVDGGGEVVGAVLIVGLKANWRREEMVEADHGVVIESGKSLLSKL
jgi:hypothetical protein